MKSISPWYINGLLHADGSFSILVEINKSSRFGYRLKPSFSITQHQKSLDVLQEIKNYFHCGKIIQQHRQCFNYTIDTFRDLDNILLPHFKNYPIQSAKFIQYAQWLYIYNLLKQKKHTTPAGFAEIILLILKINRFPQREKKLHIIYNSICKQYNIQSSVENSIQEICLSNDWNVKANKMNSLNPAFVTGLIDGDGTFTISFRKSGRIDAQFALGQERIHLDLLYALNNFFKVGNVYKVYDNYLRYVIWDIKMLYKLFSNHFKDYPLRTAKQKDWIKFSQVCDMLRRGKPLTKQEKYQIKYIYQELKLSNKKDELKV